MFNTYFGLTVVIDPNASIWCSLTCLYLTTKVLKRSWRLSLTYVTFGCIYDRFPQGDRRKVNNRSATFFSDNVPDFSARQIVRACSARACRLATLYIRLVFTSAGTKTTALCVAFRFVAVCGVRPAVEYATRGAAPIVHSCLCLWCGHCSRRHTMDHKLKKRKKIKEKKLLNLNLSLEFNSTLIYL